jgi:hypothetical protein
MKQKNKMKIEDILNSAKPVPKINCQILKIQKIKNQSTLVLKSRALANPLLQASRSKYKN